MEDVLNEVIDEKELEKVEKKYRQDNGASTQITFEYAVCLVRSAYSNDIHKGIQLLESLALQDPANKREYIYFLALAHTRVKQYNEAIKFSKAFLEIEPSNVQVRTLEKYITDQRNKEVARGAAVAGTALALGGLLVGIALAKK